MAVQSWRFFIALFIYGFGMSSGALDATAVLMECKKGSSKDDINRISPPYHTIDSCHRKIRITVNITNFGKTPPDLDYSFLSHLSDPETGTTMYLLNPVVLRLRQNQVLLAYPFHFLSAVNAKATEVVLNYENRKNFTGCDDTSQINPTCGVKHEKGTPVPFSEGFCCSCPETPVRENQPRGGQDCYLDVGDPTDVEKQRYKASAHCLHLSDIWYSVCALSQPFILHETFMQVYIQKHLKNKSSVWVALTDDEDFKLDPQNPYQYNDNKTILISYLTSSPIEKSVTVPIAERRLLIPQPMPAVELSRLPTPVKNGANDYLLLPKDIIQPGGEDCDVAGVSYEGFAKQPDRCNVVRDSCLKNQPLDFWEMDNDKRSAGAKGNYLLENFGIPYKDPIIVDPETKDHWLAIEYHEPHVTSLIIEINADEIVVMGIGKKAQISKLTSSTINNIISIYASILNRGLMPAKFTIQAVKCAFEVPDSSKVSVMIPPQMTEDVVITTKQGSISLDEKFACTVQVSSEAYKVVATRKVIIHPRSRCICNFHCDCVCLSDTLQCELMSEEDYQAAGFLGSLPILTAKPPYKNWFIQHPYLALLAFILFLLLFGLIKGILGLAGCRKIGNCGMDQILYQPKKIKRYREPELRNVDVVYDDEGYPIHPDTQERVKVVSDELLLVYNLLFLFFWPCLKCRQGIEKASKLKKKLEMPKEDKDSSSEKESQRKDKIARDSSPNETSKLLKEEHLSKKRDKRNPGTKDEDVTKRPGTSGVFTEDLTKSKEVRPSPDKKFEERKGSYVSDSELDKEMSSGPVADSVNKELVRWRKGKIKIDAVKK